MDPIISIRNLSKNYGHKQVLHDISLDIFPGQVIGYIGPNGAGKSTTVKILCGLITDFTGDITVAGLDLRHHALEIKRKIGYVPELADIYDLLTATEYLHFIASLYDIPTSFASTRIRELLEAFDLSAASEQRIESYSKGMKQKVLLCSGLLHDPQILFLDEPLSGLDANSVLVVKELIQGLATQGKTIFYCSHMMDIVEKVSDKIILIDKGNIIANGTLTELKAQLGEMSLEQMFAQLTAHQSHQLISGKILDALK